MIIHQGLDIFSKSSDINFLAHLYLSGNGDKIKVGNFIGDFVKGSQFQEFHPEIILGIQLHREIDMYTDNHRIVALSKDKLRARYRHYAGVVVDMFYDHFLASNFDLYSKVPLHEFAQTSYRLLQKYWDVIPPKGQNMLPYMIKGNWLLGYAQKEGIHRALTGLSRRTRFESHLDMAIQDLTKHYDTFEQEFHNFFPQIIHHISQFREDLINSSQ